MYNASKYFFLVIRSMYIITLYNAFKLISFSLGKKPFLSLQKYLYYKELEIPVFIHNINTDSNKPYTTRSFLEAITYVCTRYIRNVKHPQILYKSYIYSALLLNDSGCYPLDIILYPQRYRFLILFS